MEEQNNAVLFADGGVVASYAFSPTAFTLTAGDIQEGTLVLEYNENIFSVEWNIAFGTIQPTQCQLYIQDFSDYECNFQVDASNAINAETNTIEISARITYWLAGTSQMETTTEVFSVPFRVLKRVEINPDIPNMSGITSGDTTESGSTSGDTTTGDTTFGVLSASPESMIFKTNQTQGLLITSTTNNVLKWEVDARTTGCQATISTSSTTDCVLTINPSTPLNEKPIRGSVIVKAYYDVAETIVREIEVPITILGFVSYPVWEDNIYQFDDVYGNSVNYELIDVGTGDVIYAGTANKMPDKVYVEVNFAKIVRNYLTTEFPYLIYGAINYRNKDYSKKINVVVDGEIIATMLFYDSWGYEALPVNFNLSQPIRKVVDRRQYFLWSMFSPTTASTLSSYVLANSGRTYNRSTFNVNNEQLVIVDRYLSDFNEFDQIRIGGKSLDLIDSCKEYCLYYKNAFNGWDSLLVGGNAVKTDKINSQYFTKNFNNKTIEFGKTKYLNVITPSYKLYTDWFNDEEQGMLYHLLESTEVYLHNLITNKIEPVNITNSTCDYKTFTNNGKKKWYNTINVEVAQERIRQ